MIELKKSSILATFVFSMRSGDGGLSFNTNKLDKFSTGSIFIVPSKDNRFNRIISGLVTPLTNLLISLFSGKIGQVIVDNINKFGSEIPS